MFAKYSPLKLDGKYGKALGARVKVNSSISAAYPSKENLFAKSIFATDQFAEKENRQGNHTRFNNTF